MKVHSTTPADQNQKTSESIILPTLPPQGDHQKPFACQYIKTFDVVSEPSPILK